MQPRAVKAAASFGSTYSKNTTLLIKSGNMRMPYLEFF